MTDFVGKTTAELIEFYNAKASLMDRPLVKRFTDRKAAERRCAQIEAAVQGVANVGKLEAAPEASAETEATQDTPEEAFEVEMPEPEAPTTTENEPTAETGETKESDMATKKAAKKTGKKASPKKTVKKAGMKTGAKTGNGHGPGDHGMVGKGTNREKLLALFEKHKGYQVSVSQMMKAVYGEARKDLKGPIMMVMKGLQIVFKTQKKPWEFRKTRENKENYFGLYNKSDK